MPVDLFAGVCVRDHDAAVPWYTRLFGTGPEFVASDTESVWTVGDRCWVYVQQRADKAGGALLSIFLDDLDAFVAAAREAGIEPTAEESYPGDVRKIVFTDADGNEIGFGGPLPD